MGPRSVWIAISRSQLLGDLNPWLIRSQASRENGRRTRKHAGDYCEKVFRSWSLSFCKQFCLHFFKSPFASHNLDPSLDHLAIRPSSFIDDLIHEPSRSLEPVVALRLTDSLQLSRPIVIPESILHTRQHMSVLITNRCLHQ